MIFKIKYSECSTFSRKTERKRQGKMCKWMVTDLRRSICEPWVRPKITPAPSKFVGRDNTVSTATRYVLDGPGIESRYGRNFLHRPDRPCCPPYLLYNGYRVSFRKLICRRVAWRLPLTPPSVVVKE
jgi:hypothetical protein